MHNWLKGKAAVILNNPNLLTFASKALPLNNLPTAKYQFPYLPASSFFRTFMDPSHPYLKNYACLVAFPG